MSRKIFAESLTGVSHVFSLVVFIDWLSSLIMDFNFFSWEIPCGNPEVLGFPRGN